MSVIVDNILFGLTKKYKKKEFGENEEEDESVQLTKYKNKTSYIEHIDEIDIMNIGYVLE